MLSECGLDVVWVVGGEKREKRGYILTSITLR